VTRPPLDEVEIEVYQTDWGTWHYKVYEPQRRGYGGIITSDCGSLCKWEWWGRRWAIHCARKKARQFMKKQLRGDRTYRETVTLDGRPSRAQLERTIAELEQKLDIN
jgi:hypothetical protein